MGKVLTISIAAYNVEGTIRKALDSIRDAGVPDEIEVLIVNDGSTDRTSQIAKEYESALPGTFRVIDKENGGYGSTINCGVREAKGRYFKQLDGDDWFVPERLADLTAVLNDTDADLVVTQVLRHDEGSGEEVLRDYLPDQAEETVSFEHVTVPGLLPMHSVTYKTALLRQTGRPITEHCFYTDIEYAMYPVPLVQTVLALHMPVYVYRIGVEGQSVSASGIAKHYKEHRKVLGHIFRFYDEHADMCASKRDLVLNRIKMELSRHLKYICMLPVSAQHCREFRGFVRMVRRRYPEILAETASFSRFTALAGKADGLAYPLLCILVRTGLAD